MQPKPQPGEGVLASRPAMLMPELEGTLRAHNVKRPAEAQAADGIRILGRPVRSVVYTTDIAIIRNCDADAVFAVYPFTPQQVISEMLVKASSIPVLVGVGGGTTGGSRCAVLASNAEAAGAYGVVLNAPASNATVEMVSRVVDVPVIVTVVDGDPEIARNRIEPGASVLNASAGKGTPAAVAQLRTRYPELPLLATGGKTGADIEATVAAGANAVICTPPSNRELFSPMMERYRGSVGTHSQARELRPLSQVAQDEIRDRVRELRDGALASGLGPGRPT